jgi:Trypsin-co-occurring domain 2
MSSAADPISAIAGELGGQIETVVGHVNDAIAAAQQGSPSVVVTDIDLTLNAVTTRSGGGDFSISIFGHSLGGNAELDSVDTQTIELKLTPKGGAELQRPSDDVSQHLTGAILAVGQSLVAVSSKASLEKAGATVELNFEIDKDGKVSFFVFGEKKTANTQSVKLTLARAGS